MKRIDILIVFFLFIMVIPAEYHETFSWLEDQTISLRHGIRSNFGSRDATVFPDDKIVLVTIDDGFFEKYGKFPVRRADIAVIIQNLDRLGAKVICTDLLFELPGSFNGDRALAGAIKGKKVILASRAVFDENNNFKKIRYPIPSLKNNCPTGYINLTSPSSISTFLSRLRVWPEITLLEDGWPIAVQIVSEYMGVKPEMKNGRLLMGDISIPLDHFNDIYIDFSSLPKMHRFLHQSAGISAWDFLDISGLDQYEIMELKAWVENKIVILGEATAVSHDWFDTPVGMIYGMEIIADTVSTLLKQAPLRPVSFYMEILISFLFFSAIVFCTVYTRIPFLQTLSAAACFPVFIFFCTFLYAYQGLIVSMTCNLIAGISSFFILSLSSYFRERKYSNARRMEKEQAERERQIAQAATQAKSEFLANMSHEIRTPMNSVLGFLELVLEESNLPEFQRNSLATAHNSAKALLSLINDILDLSKLESGRLELEKHPFDLRQMLEDIIKIFENKCREKGLNLSLDIHPDLPLYYIGDQARLRQIIINLLGNAVKFTETGGITVAAALHNADALNMLHFSVSDTGIGIRPDRVDKIFEPFTQADSSTSRRFGGTGLGTTISRQLTELMGGKIWAESQEGKGSVFHFTVNMEPADKDQVSFISGISEQSAFDNNSLPINKRYFRILVAEDIQVNMTLAQIRLTQHGHQIIKAWNGKEAVKKYQQEAPDIILMDVQMPEMDGLEAARQIRQLETDTHIPIVALTASLMKNERDNCLLSGMDAVLGKPINFDELFDVMEKLVPEDAGNNDTLWKNREGSNDFTTPDCQPLLPEIKGVDIKKGLALWKDEAVFKKALLGFCKYENAADDMLKLVRDGDREGAYRIAHALKGVSGNLAITGVYNIAETLNAAVMESPSDELIFMIASLKSELKSVLSSIGDIEQEQEKPECPKEALDMTELKELFRGMLASLEEYSPSAVTPFLEKMKLSFPSHQTDPIEQQVENFDFDKARDETFRLAKESGIDEDELKANISSYIP